MIDKEKAAVEECVRSFYEEFKATMKYADATFYPSIKLEGEVIGFSDNAEIALKPKKTVKPKRAIKRLSQANFMIQLEKVNG